MASPVLPARLAPLALLVAALPAQEPDFIRQLGTPAEDGAADVAPDGAGGFFVVGSTAGALAGPAGGTGGQTLDVWLGRFDGSGEPLWLRQFGGSTSEEPFSLATDGAGGFFVAGATRGAINAPGAGSGNGFLARFDGAGNTLWTVEQSTGSTDAGTAVVSDGQGGAIVAGSTRGALFGPAGDPTGGALDPWLARYDASGARVWALQLTAPDSESFVDAAPDGAGGVFVCGSRQLAVGAFPTLGWLARFDGNGAELWRRDVSLPASIDDCAAVAADGAGGVYVCGSTTGPLGGPALGLSDAWVARFDGAGNLLWSQQAGSAGADFGLAIAADGDGVAVAGETFGSVGAPNAGGSDVWLARFDAQGVERSRNQLGSPGLERPLALAPDGHGGVLAVGETRGSLGGPAAGGSFSITQDAWIARLLPELDPPRFCAPAAPNSTGLRGTLSAEGSNVVRRDDFTLRATELPAGTFTLFLVAPGSTAPTTPAGSQGALCLGTGVARFNRPGEVRVTDASGAVSLPVALGTLPSPAGPTAVLPLDTWAFQAWFRDGAGTSNFTDGIEVRFY